MGGLGLSAPQFCGMLRANTATCTFLFDLYQSNCPFHCFYIHRGSGLTRAFPPSQFTMLHFLFFFCLKVSGDLRTRAGRSLGFVRCDRFYVNTVAGLTAEEWPGSAHVRGCTKSPCCRGVVAQEICLSCTMPCPMMQLAPRAFLCTFGALRYYLTEKGVLESGRFLSVHTRGEQIRPRGQSESERSFKICPRKGRGAHLSDDY